MATSGKSPARPTLGILYTHRPTSLSASSATTTSRLLRLKSGIVRSAISRINERLSQVWGQRSMKIYRHGRAGFVVLIPRVAGVNGAHCDVNHKHHPSAVSAHRRAESGGVPARRESPATLCEHRARPSVVQVSCGWKRSKQTNLKDTSIGFPKISL